MKNLKQKLYIGLCLMLLMLIPKNTFAIEVADEEGLKAVITSGEKDITLTKDIVLTKDEKLSSRTIGLEIKGEGTIKINGNGHKISTPLDIAIRVNTNEGTNLNIIFENITIEAVQRAIDTRSAGISLELNKTKLVVTSKGNNQALTIGGKSGRVSASIIDSNIYAGDAGYGIITFNPVDMIIQNSTITGYAALYMKGADNSEGSAGSIVAITDSNVVGTSKFSGESDNFGTIVLEDNNIDINIVGSKVIANNIEGTSYQVPFLQRNETSTDEEKNDITILGNSEIIVNTKNNEKSIAVGNLNLTVGAGTMSNVPIEEHFLEDGATITYDENGNTLVIVENPDTSDLSVLTTISILLIGIAGITFIIKNKKLLLAKEF